jgi:hypothetical protein
VQPPTEGRGEIRKESEAESKLTPEQKEELRAHNVKCYIKKMAYSEYVGDCKDDTATFVDADYLSQNKGSSYSSCEKACDDNKDCKSF